MEGVGVGDIGARMNGGEYVLVWVRVTGGVCKGDEGVGIGCVVW